MPQATYSVLIANRGEIAVRVMRTCREMGLRTIAVHSEADRGALHVRTADTAVEIGPAVPSASYLNIERVVDAASRAGANAVHPGYGFLSENADFAEACSNAGLTFIGPPPEAIRVMGDKTEARRLMASTGVGMAPGTPDAIKSVDEARSVADEIGYPVLLKAAAGGGGRGMRIVRKEPDLERALEAAAGEAAAAFGDGRVFMEKYIESPRHIEIQVFCDTHGQAMHLFERECSVQRRHQKVVEEAPSPAIDPDTRNRMGEAAIRAARACGYVGAGTVEFLLDADGSFYFMEMNTRLQVEHPVTELITGLDLVALQIQIARGEKLPPDLPRAPRGHAIECRVYAEDPASGFLPDSGRLRRHRMPAGPGVRVDAGVEEEDDVPIHYDPMISKLCTWGQDRDEARRRMVRALDEYDVAGVATTIPFCRFVMVHPAFVAGRYDTHFVENHYRPTQGEAGGLPPSVAAATAALVAHRGGPSNTNGHDRHKVAQGGVGRDVRVETHGGQRPPGTGWETRRRRD